MNAAASAPCSAVLPTKMAKARPREIDREAMRIATANENTMPMLANVRSMPEAMPNDLRRRGLHDRGAVGGEEGSSPRRR